MYYVSATTCFSQEVDWERIHPLIVNPHIALIRTSKERGEALYEGVMRRIGRRDQQPHGIVFHFSLWSEETFQVGTVFGDSASMLDAFVGYSAPEAQNEIASLGLSVDVSRDEHRLERLWVSGIVPARIFTSVPASGIAAWSSKAADMSVEDYRKQTAEIGRFDDPVPGCMASLAYRLGDTVRTIDFWESREHGEDSYAANGQLTDEALAKGWLDLNTLVVCVPPNDPQRNFTRTEDGPVQV